MAKKKQFKISEIEDVLVIIKARGKNYSIVPCKGLDKEKGKSIRILFLQAILENHCIIDTPIEELKKMRDKPLNEADVADWITCNGEAEITRSTPMKEDHLFYGEKEVNRLILKITKELNP